LPSFLALVHFRPEQPSLFIHCCISHLLHIHITSPGVNREKDISAQQSEKKKDPRLSRTHEHKKREKGPQETQGKGTTASVGLITGEGNTPPNSRARSRPDHRFPRSERLVTKDAYDAVYKKGKRIRISPLSFAYAPNDMGFSRLGISVGKAFGNAVRRNRAKRIIRELFRRNKHRIPQGYDIVASPRRGFLDLEWKEIEKTYLTFASVLKGEKGS